MDVDLVQDPLTDVDGAQDRKNLKLNQNIVREIEVYQIYQILVIQQLLVIQKILVIHQILVKVLPHLIDHIEIDIQEGKKK